MRWIGRIEPKGLGAVVILKRETENASSITVLAAVVDQRKILVGEQLGGSATLSMHADGGPHVLKLGLTELHRCGAGKVHMDVGF